METIVEKAKSLINEINTDYKTSTFQQNHSFEKRANEAQRILDKYPDRIPVIVEKDPRCKDIPDIDRKKYLVPDDLKACADLIEEWWPIRKKKGAVNSTKVARRIFDTLRSFPSQDRKEALEKAITAGWKDIYPLKKGYKPEEPKNNHPASRVFTAERGFE